MYFCWRESISCQIDINSRSLLRNSTADKLPQWPLQVNKHYLNLSKIWIYSHKTTRFCADHIVNWKSNFCATFSYVTLSIRFFVDSEISHVQLLTRGKKYCPRVRKLIFFLNLQNGYRKEREKIRKGQNRVLERFPCKRKQ